MRLAGGGVPQGCAGSRIALAVRGLKVRRRPTVAVLDADCTFHAALTGRARRGAKVAVTATFTGLPGVAPATDRARAH